MPVVHVPINLIPPDQSSHLEAAKSAEKVADAGVTREAGYLYFIDKNGNVGRSPMARGRK